MRIYTIGHSTRTLDELVAALRSFEIRTLVDIRTVPRSRHTPQFNREDLGPRLRDRGIDYRHLPGLGGLRKPRAGSANTAWRNASFSGFADYMETSEFAARPPKNLLTWRISRMAIATPSSSARRTCGRSRARRRA